MDPDDLTYKKSVRNMAVVIVAIVITAFAGVFASPYLFPPSPILYQKSVTQGSSFGSFELHLEVNSSEFLPDHAILVTGWVNSTSNNVYNATALNAWQVGPGGLFSHLCTNGWPIGVGLVPGHYTSDNISLGTPIPFPMPACPVLADTPKWFLFEPLSSKVLVSIGGNPAQWVLQSSIVYKQNYLTGNDLQPGVYTAVLADEWGDVVTLNILIS